MEEQIFYRVRHKETGLHWKGGGISNHIKNRIDADSKDDVLKEAFSKFGKSYMKKQHVISAFRHQLRYGEEPELTRILLDECEIIECKTVLLSSIKPRDLVESS